MWTLALSVAFGAPVVEDEALDRLPWRLESVERWTLADQRATRVARAGSWAAGIGGAATLVGSGLVALGSETGDDTTIATGALLAVTGTITAITAPPIALAGSVRANRSLRQRGVVVSPAASIVGWTLYGTGLVMVPALVAAGASEDGGGGFLVLGTAWYASIFALPLGQVDVNRRGREAAGLTPFADDRRALPVLAVVPSRNGVALAGAF